MGHVTPIVDAVFVGRNLRVVVHPAIDVRSSHDLSQIVDAGGIGRMPAEINCCCTAMPGKRYGNSCHEICSWAGAHGDIVLANDTV